MRRFLQITGQCVLLILSLSVTACSHGHVGGDQARGNPGGDPHSFARPDQARITHMDIDLKADFVHHRLVGQVRLELQTRPEARQIVLDTRNLDIGSVTNALGAPLKFTLSPDQPVLGRALSIDLPQGQQVVIVHYQTTPASRALQWLTPAQTAGKSAPFVYSQGESLMTREWLPVQDAPSLKFTWKGRILVPRAMKAVMSGAALTPEGETVAGAGDLRAFRFEMTHPVSPYLIAVAAGDIAFAETGPRTGVWAERSLIGRAKSEFAELETMLKAQETIMGPYRWERYEILVLPPSFPYRGMENARLTFVSPTLLAGDRSMTYLIAHEMSHSWAGNLVTNASWNDYWLNEGMANYFESRTLEALYGEGRARIDEVRDDQLMDRDIKAFTAEGKADLTRLSRDVDAMDPDDVDSEIPYGKGAAFMRVIEHLVGRARFDAYLKGYFSRYAYASIDTHGFEADLESYLIRHDPLIEAQLHLKAWLYGDGLPGNMPWARSEVLEQVDLVAKRFVAGADPRTLDLKTYSPDQWQRFLADLSPEVTVAQLKLLDEAYGLSRHHNAIIAKAWFLVVIAHHYEQALGPLQAFLTSTGCQAYVAPLYQALMKQPPWGPVLARRIAAQAAPLYHQVVRNAVVDILKGEAATSSSSQSPTT